MVESGLGGYPLIMRWGDLTEWSPAATPSSARRTRSLAFGLVGFAVTVSSGGEAMDNVRSAIDAMRSPAVEAVAIATMVPSAPALHALIRRAWRHRQIAQALGTLEADAALTGSAAAAVERESERTGVDPLLVVAVIAYENPELDPGAVSPAGALGIMQVMPRWKASFRNDCGDDLLSVDTNICFGVRILQLHIDDAGGSMERGLLAYVGCVKDLACRRYPELVLRRRVALSELALDQ
jgi:soluble lytic murein transglycosylase-like protein